MTRMISTHPEWARRSIAVGRWPKYRKSGLSKVPSMSIARIRRNESAATVNFSIQAKWRHQAWYPTRQYALVTTTADISYSNPFPPPLGRIIPHAGPSMKLRLRVLFLFFLPASLPAQSAPQNRQAFSSSSITTKLNGDTPTSCLQLFKKNHYPLLKKEVEMGRMLKVWMDQPRYHTTEDVALGLSRDHRLRELPPPRTSRSKRMR